MTDISTELVTLEAPQPESAAVVLWGTDDPRGMTSRMTAIADALADAIEARGMFTTISGRKYVLAEGWSLVGAMVGVFPHPRLVEELRDQEGNWFGFRATVDLVTRDGGVVGGAVALCTVNEAQWRDRDPNQIASMAQTRATAKAYRSTLGFIMPMAGYAATPAEEMEGVAPARPAAPKPASGWASGAETFIQKACAAYELDVAALFRTLEVANVDELIERAQRDPHHWNGVAEHLRDLMEPMTAVAQ
jgi:hypothetical protein